MTYYLHSIDKNLKFTIEISGKSLGSEDLKITSDDKKLLTSVYSTATDSHLYLDGTSCHSTKSIDGISTRVPKQLKQICSNDSNFLEQSKEYSANLAAQNHQLKEIIRAFEQINNKTKINCSVKKSKKHN